MEVDGNGYGAITGRGGPFSLGPPPTVSVNLLVPLLSTGVRHHPPGRTDKNLCRCFGAPAARFSLITDHWATRVRGRGRTGGDGLTAYAYCRVGPLHRETAWLGVGLRAD